MYVAPEAQRQRLRRETGRARLLLPPTHLVGFYWGQGFYVLEPLLPVHKTVGHPYCWPREHVIDAIFYKLGSRKRHILMDTPGLLLNVVAHPADVHDHKGRVANSF